MLQSKEQIGKLDRKITFQVKDTERNRANEPAEVGWNDYAVNVWARVDERSGNEQYRGDKEYAYTITTFTIRYRLGLKEGMRILFNNRIYDLLAILFDDRKRFMTITGESGGEYVESSTGGGFSSGYDDGFEVD